ncbi:MAG: hypothetical protein IPL32_03960 [Chloracidobacterium sp.]|nr:hypothetical protein [Chloracidobacterium sp.]
MTAQCAVLIFDLHEIYVNITQTLRPISGEYAARNNLNPTFAAFSVAKLTAYYGVALSITPPT